MKKIISGLTVLAFVVGFTNVVMAQKNISTPNARMGEFGLSAFFSQVNIIINYIVPFLVGIAVLIVIYGIFGFISNAADEEARANAKQFIIWGVIGIFAMLSVWGLVTILDNTFSFQKDSEGIVVPMFSDI